jgi:toxin ParE1/3/4
MGYEVRLTAKARGDLNEIVAYIAQDNPLAAERLGDELAAEAVSLSNYPYRGGVVRRRRNVRRLVHGSYLIVYRIFESNRLIEILRFWHVKTSMLLSRGEASGRARMVGARPPKSRSSAENDLVHNRASFAA